MHRIEILEVEEHYIKDGNSPNIKIKSLPRTFRLIILLILF